MKFIYLLPFLFFAPLAFSADDDAVNKAAMVNTEELLKNVDLFKAAAQETNDGKGAASQLDAITKDPAQQQKIREISARIFKKMNDKNGSDDSKNMQSLEAAKANPEAFAKQISAEDMAQIRRLASEIESQKK